MSKSRHKKRRDRLLRLALIQAGIFTDDSVDDGARRLNAALNSQDLWIGEVPSKAKRWRVPRSGVRN